MQAAKPPIRVPAGKRVVKMKMEPLLPMVMTPENVKRAGQTRWLTVEEVLTILRHSPGPFWPLESDRCNDPTSKCCMIARKRGAYLFTLIYTYGVILFSYPSARATLWTRFVIRESYVSESKSCGKFRELYTAKRPYGLDA